MKLSAICVMIALTQATRLSREDLSNKALAEAMESGDWEDLALAQGNKEKKKRKQAAAAVAAENSMIIDIEQRKIMGVPLSDAQYAYVAGKAQEQAAIQMSMNSWGYANN